MRISIGSFLALTFLVADAASAQNLSGNWGNICGGNLRFQERPGVVEFDCDNVDFHHHFSGGFEGGARKSVRGSIIRRQVATGCQLGPIPAHITVVDDHHVVYDQGNWPVGCGLTAPAGGGTQDWKRP
jgi:hypothetical protein